MTGDERLRKLEESQSFNDRAVEELCAEVRELSRRVSDLAAAMARFESRLTAMQNPEPESEEE